jgi:hypothetical protein
VAMEGHASLSEQLKGDIAGMSKRCDDLERHLEHARGTDLFLPL